MAANEAVADESDEALVDRHGTTLFNFMSMRGWADARVTTPVVRNRRAILSMCDAGPTHHDEK